MATGGVPSAAGFVVPHALSAVPVVNTMKANVATRNCVFRCGQNVTFPARQFTAHGQRRSFSLLRAIDDPAAQDRVRELVLQAYRADAQEINEAAS